MLEAVEIAYRKGLKDGCGIKEISPYLLTSQAVAREIVNKYYAPAVSESVCMCKTKNISGVINGVAYCEDCGLPKQTVC